MKATHVCIRMYICMLKQQQSFDLIGEKNIYLQNFTVLSMKNRCVYKNMLTLNFLFAFLQRNTEIRRWHDS